MVRFIHTSDWQLGDSMGQVPGDKGALLRAERLNTLERIGRLAGEHGVDFVVVAGDLFDAHTVANEVVTRAMEVLSGFPVPVFAIPGNHDFADTPESIYRRKRFVDRCPDQLHLLIESQPLNLPNGDLTLLPCPLVQRHTVADPTRWLRTDRAATAPGQIRIAVAHGSVVDFEAEDGGTTPNLIDPGVVEAASLDYLALGDWHGTRQVGPRSWYSGTPEPDRFKDNQAGHVLVVEIDQPGTVPRVHPVASAGCRWVRHDVQLHDADDLAALKRWFAELQIPHQTLVRLQHSGVLGMRDLQELDDLLETQAERLLHLRVRGPGVQLQPTDEEIDSIGTEGLTGRVAEALRELADRPGDEGRTAGLALQMLFQHAGAAAREAGP